MWFISAYDQIPKWLMIDNGLIPYLHDFSSSAFPFPKKMFVSLIITMMNAVKLLLNRWQ